MTVINKYGQNHGKHLPVYIALTYISLIPSLSRSTLRYSCTRTVNTFLMNAIVIISNDFATNMKWRWREKKLFRLHCI